MIGAYPVGAAPAGSAGTAAGEPVSGIASPLGDLSARAWVAAQSRLALGSPLGTFRAVAPGPTIYPIDDHLWADAPGFTEWRNDAWVVTSGGQITPKETARVWFDRNSAGNALRFTVSIQDALNSANHLAQVRIVFTDESFWNLSGAMSAALESAGQFVFDLPFSAAGGETSEHLPAAVANVNWADSSPIKRVKRIDIDFGYRNAVPQTRRFTVTRTYLVLTGLGFAEDALHPRPRQAWAPLLSPLGDFRARVAPAAQALAVLTSPLSPFAGVLHRTVYPPPASSLPADAFTFYFCTLTGAANGLPDVSLPMSAFSVRHRAGADSYYQVVIPTTALVDEILSRQDGEIVITAKTGSVVEELIRGELASLQTAVGANSQSVTISGNTPTAPTSAQTYPLTQVLYQSTTNTGETRLRIPPRAAIRPGDTVIYRGIYTTVGDVSWGVSVSGSSLNAQMEISA